MWLVLQNNFGRFQMKHEFQAGYLQALHDLDVKITEFIRQNNGAITSEQVVNVFNQTLGFIHLTMKNIKEDQRLASAIHTTHVDESVNYHIPDMFISMVLDHMAKGVK